VEGGTNACKVDYRKRASRVTRPGHSFLHPNLWAAILFHTVFCRTTNSNRRTPMPFARLPIQTDTHNDAALVLAAQANSAQRLHIS
jgi:hypothetical protein